MAGPERLPRDYLKARQAHFSGAYQMSPGEYFPIPTVNERNVEQYVPVNVIDALQQKAVAKRRATLLLRLAQLNNFDDREDERLERIEKAVNGYSVDHQPIVLFYLLGYSIDDRYLVSTSRELSLDELLEEVLRVGSSGIRKIRASAILAPRKEFYGDWIMKLRDQTEGLNDFTINVVKPIAELEAIILRETAFFIIGGEIIRGGVWVVEWLSGLRLVQQVVSTVRFLQNFLSIISAFERTFFVLSLAKNYLFALCKLLLIALQVKGAYVLAREILDQFAIIYRYISGVRDSFMRINDEGGIALEGWEVSDDPLENTMLDYLQSTLPRDIDASLQTDGASR